jgi:hypothetical protein
MYVCVHIDMCTYRYVTYRYVIYGYVNRHYTHPYEDSTPDTSVPSPCTVECREIFIYLTPATRKLLFT